MKKNIKSFIVGMLIVPCCFYSSFAMSTNNIDPIWCYETLSPMETGDENQKTAQNTQMQPQLTVVTQRQPNPDKPSSASVSSMRLRKPTGALPTSPMEIGNENQGKNSNNVSQKITKNRENQPSSARVIYENIELTRKIQDHREAVITLLLRSGEKNSGNQPFSASAVAGKRRPQGTIVTNGQRNPGQQPLSAPASSSATANPPADFHANHMVDENQERKEAPKTVLDNLLAQVQEAWNAGELERFDALVGNTLCEITASMIADHSDKNIVVSDNLNDPVTLFIFVAFLLTKYKVKEPNNKSTLHEHSEHVDLGKLFSTGRAARELCSHAQRLLAAESIKYLQDKATELNLPMLKDILERFIVVDGWGRLLVPFYVAIRTFLLYTISIQRPLIICYKYFCNTDACKDGHHMLRFFVVADGRGTLIYTLPSQQDSEKNAIIYTVWGCSQELFDPNRHILKFSDRKNLEHAHHCEDSLTRGKLIMACNIKDLIDMESAQHSQWAGSTGSEKDDRQDLYTKLPKEISDAMRDGVNRAHEYGIAIENQYFFSIIHVFPGKVKNYIRIEQDGV